MAVPVIAEWEALGSCTTLDGGAMLTSLRQERLYNYVEFR